jgi:Cadherin-like domain
MKMNMKWLLFMVIVTFAMISCDNNSTINISNNQNNTNNLNNTNNVDPCASIDCGDNGECVVVNDIAGCECDTGYYADGLACVENNTAPAITSLPATEQGEWGKSDSFTVVTTEANSGDTLSYSLSDNSCSFTPTVDDQGIVSWICGDVESCSINVTVSDDGSPILSDMEILNIECVNSIPSFDSVAATEVDENTEYGYSITCSDPEGDSLNITTGASHTCDGTLIDNGNNTATYSFFATEAMGGSDCNVHILCSDGQTSESQTTLVTIIDNNSAPQIIGLPATESGIWGHVDSFQLVSSDTDLPENVLSWGVDNSTCSFVPTIDSSGLMEWTCGGVETCDVQVRLVDDGTPVLDATGLLTIQCVNSLPIFDSTPLTTGTEHVLYGYNVMCSDPEGDSLSLAIGASDTCDGTIIDNNDGTGTYSFTPTELMGGASCTLHVTCGDGNATESQTAQIDISEINASPILTSLPATEQGVWGVANSHQLTFTDSDLPSQTMTWLINSTNCSFTPTVDVAGLVSWTCNGVESCSLEVNGTDNGSPTLDATGVLNIECLNQAPVITTSPSVVAIEHVVYNYAVNCSDIDGNALMFSLNAEDTCGGIITDNHDGTGDYSFTPDEDMGGTSCVVSISCSDTQEVDEQSATINITETNEAPVITNTMTASSHWDATGTFDADYTDSDLPAQTILWSISANSCTGFSPVVDSSTGVVSWTCSGMETCSVDVTATDNGMPSVKSDTKTLAISCVNTIPSINSTAPASGTEGAAYAYVIDCTDADNDLITLSVNSGNDTCGGAITGATYSFTPDETMGGNNCIVAVNCSDTQEIASENTTVTITETNEAPVITNLPTTKNGHWGDPNTFTLVATDSDLPAQTFTYSISSETCANFNPSINASSGLVSWNCGDVESCSVVVAVSDGVTSTTGSLAIECTNQAPTISSIPVTAATEKVLYSYLAMCSDVDADALVVSKGASDTCGGVIIDNHDGTGNYSFTPDENMGGASCVMSISCSDTQAVDEQSATINVTETNEAPVITNTMTASSHWDAAGTFDADYTDSDLPAQTILWSLSANSCTGFSPVVDSSTGVVSWTCTVMETCSVDVTATDNGMPSVKSDTETLAISCVNTIPAINSTAPASGTEGTAYTYVIDCTDADTDVVALSVNSGNDTCGGTIAGVTYSFTPDETMGGNNCIVAVNCTDTQEIASQDNTVSITETNETPVITNLPATQNGHWGEPNIFSLITTDSDLPAQTFAYSISSETCVNFNPSINTSSGLVSWNCGDVETCSVAVAVSDGVVSVNSSLSIGCQNEAPTIDSTPVDSIREGILYSYNIDCTDIDGDLLTLNIGVGDTCDGTIVDSGDGTGLYTFTPGPGTSGSTCTVEVACSDSQSDAIQSQVVLIGEPISDSCLEELTVNPGATDGVYNIDMGSGIIEVYCDMTGGGWTYLDLGMGNHTVNYADWDLLESTDLQNIRIQNMFIWAYNRSGLTNLNPGWNSGNCCFYGSGTTFMAFGGVYLYPNYVNGSSNCNSTYSDTSYWFYKNGTETPPLPANYFTINPVSTSTSCGINNNPGFFAKRFL